MSRSIHTTKKDLKRERYFSASDGVPFPTHRSDRSEMESQHLKKMLYKHNDGWMRASEKIKFPFVGTLKLIKGKIVYKLIRKRAPRPEDVPPTQSP